MKPCRTSIRFLTVLAIVTVAGLALRLASSMELLRVYPPVSQPSPETDMYTYQKLAQDMVSGRYDYEQGFYYQPFYYAVFLPLVYRCLGSSSQIVIVVQSVIGAFTIWLIGLLFARLFGRTAGVLAAAFVALDRMLIFYTAFTLIETLQAFWITLLCYMATVAAQRRRISTWSIVGLIHGCAVLTRGNVLLFAPAILLLVGVTLRTSPRRATSASFLYLACLIAPQLPFAWVNYRSQYHAFAPSTAADAVLALGNTPESPPGGREPGSGPGPMEYPESCQEWTRQAYLPGAARVPLWRSITRWIAQEPLAFLELKWRVFLLFWHAAEIPNNVALIAFGRQIPATIIHCPALLDFTAVGGLGLAGLIVALQSHRRRPLVLFLLAIVTIFCLVTVLFYMLARFRLPIIPLLCGFSGYASMVIYRRCRAAARRPECRRQLAATMLLATLSLVFVAGGYDLYRFGVEHKVMRCVRPRGIALDLADKWVWKDHGPASFGGWSPVKINGPMTIAKQIAVPESVPTNGHWLLRFPLLTPDSTRVTVRVASSAGVGGSHEDVFTIASGLHWLEVPLPAPPRRTDQGSFAIEMTLLTASARCSILCDSQRWYGRTQIDGKPNANDGEMVIDVVQFK